MKYSLKILLIFILTFGAFSTYGQDFVYRPVNPAFGGDTFNHNWLMSSAQAQNQFKEEDDALAGYEQDPVKDFADNLNRLILNQLSRKIVEQQFGEEGLQDGTYLLGDYEINVNTTDGGLSVGITDLVTGNQTNVQVPYF
jgi:curli production assembly/transport component CsgF